MPANQIQLPTISDLRDGLNALIEAGLGNLPAQLVIAPDETLQAVARALGHDDPCKPALMVNLGRDGERIAPAMISTEALERRRQAGFLPYRQ